MILSAQRSAAARRELLVRGIGSILLAALLLGFMATCVRVAARDLSGIHVGFFRFAGSFLVLLLANPRGRLRPRAGNLPLLVTRALFGGVSILLYYTAIDWSGAGLATLLHCTYPISTALISVLWLRESFSPALGFALALEFLGMGLVIGTGTGLPPQAMYGALCAIAASLLAGAALSTARHLRASEDAWLITTWFMGIGTLMSAPALLLSPPEIQATTLLPLAGVVLSSVAGQWLVHHGLGFTPASVGSLAAATSVLSATVCEAVFLGETLPPQAWMGAALMVAAVGLAVRRAG